MVQLLRFSCYLLLFYLLILKNHFLSVPISDCCSFSRHEVNDVSSACSHSSRLKVKVKAIQQQKVYKPTHPEPSHSQAALPGTLRFALHLPVPQFGYHISSQGYQRGNRSWVETLLRN